MIFVGTEIRQNTEAIRTATVQAIADQDTTINLTYATDDRIAELFALTHNDPEARKDENKISYPDRIRLEMALRSALRRVENIYLHVQAGFWSPRASTVLVMAGIRRRLCGTIGSMQKMDSMQDL